MVDQPKENELDEEKEATATSKEAKKLTAEEKQRAKDREKRRKARAKEAQKKNSQRQKERNKRTGGNKNRRNVWLLIAATWGCTMPMAGGMSTAARSTRPTAPTAA